MDYEEVKKLKQKLNNLTEDERIRQDLIISRNMRQNKNNLTGYASLERPWLRYYSNEKILEKANKMTCYEELYKYNKNHLNEVALEYYGTKITYKELFENIDKTAKAFKNLGVQEGDIITICSITTPEIIYAFYGLNKIGAISNMVDLRYPDKTIKNYLEESKSKLIVTLDMCYPKIKKIEESTLLEKVITISPTNSTPIPIRTVANITKKKIVPVTDKKYIDWNKFIESGKDCHYEDTKYHENQSAVIVHTGGTTGIPKGVVLTNDNLNNSLLQIKNSNVDAKRGYKFLNIMPPFIAYGIILGLHCPITLGWRTTIIPQFDATKFDELIIKYKPNGIMGVPSYWETVMKSEKIKDKHLKHVNDILLGGDFIKEEFEIKLEDYLKSHNSSAVIEKGWSETEASSNATFSTKKANKYGSVGIPLVKSIIAAYNNETNEELPLGEVGELTIQSPTIMKEYFANKEATDSVLKEIDGAKVLFTGDIGYVDKDGFVFIKDRIKRIIPRSGFKVFPSQLENLFLKNDKVEQCVVVGIPDEVDVSAPKAHIILKDQYKEFSGLVEEELNKMFDESDLPPYFKPVEYKFRTDMPHTPIGKVDYQALIKEESREKNTKVKKLSNN